MATNAELAARAKQVFTPNYRPAPLAIDRGEGMYVYDADGRRYLDMISGIAVSALGHAHPDIVAALSEQAARVLHTSNLYLNEPSIRLAEQLVAGCFADQVYFCNSGAEANEAAIKLARRHAHLAGQAERHEIVSFEKSFHGRTFLALAATGQPKYHEGFGPMPEGFSYVPYGDEAQLEAALSERTAALIVEPIQGEGGVRPPPAGFLAACRRLCDAVGAILIFDEVQVGVGRTGRLFAHQHEGVTPDVMTLAKGIGGGMPLGAMVATAEVGAALTYGSHATTYGGNPMACAAGSVVMDALNSDGRLGTILEMGEALAEGLTRIGRGGEIFSEVRGRGLLLGAELNPELAFNAKDLVVDLRTRGVLAHIAGLSVLRFAPPLILGREHVSEALDALSAVVEARLGAA